jgi:hypothetical protein
MGRGAVRDTANRGQSAKERGQTWQIRQRPLHRKRDRGYHTRAWMTKRKSRTIGTFMRKIPFLHVDHNYIYNMVIRRLTINPHFLPLLDS